MRASVMQSIGVVFLTTILLAATSAEGAIIDNLQLHATLDTADVSGATVQDIFGTPQNGTITGSVPGAAGQISQALNFPGTTNNYVGFGNVLNPGTSSYTVSLWFKPNAPITSTQFLAAKGNPTTLIPGWAMFLTSTGGGSMIVRGNDGGPTWFGQTVTFNDTDWHHAALVIDTDSNTLTGYLDGSNAGFSNAGTAGNTVTGSITTTEPIELGRRKATNDIYFNGLLDDFAIWDRALSAAELQTIYQNGLLGENLQYIVPPPVVPIPEPSALALLGLGLGGAAFARQRRRNRG